MADLPPTSTSPPPHIYTGTCLCTSITITLTLPYDLYAKHQGHICHCANCRKSSSSASGASCIMLPTSQVQLRDPDNKLKTYNDTNTKSGRTVPRSFCGECGTPVGCVPTGMEALSIVALGFFENIPKPVFECFVESKVEWAKDVVEPEKRYEYVDEIEEYVGSVMAGEGYGA